MSERYCPSCGRPLPHIWPERPFGSGIAKIEGEIMSPSCYQVPESYAANSVERIGPTCRQMDAEEWGDVEEEEKAREREKKAEADHSGGLRPEAKAWLGITPADGWDEEPPLTDETDRDYQYGTDNGTYRPSRED